MITHDARRSLSRGNNPVPSPWLATAVVPVVLADKGYQGDAYAKIPYRGRTSRNPRNRPTKRTRNSAHPGKGRTPSSRPAQDLVHPPQAPLLPLARQTARQGHPRIAGPRGKRGMKTFKDSSQVSAYGGPSAVQPQRLCNALVPVPRCCRVRAAEDGGVRLPPGAARARRRHLGRNTYTGLRDRADRCGLRDFCVS